MGSVKYEEYRRIVQLLPAEGWVAVVADWAFEGATGTSYTVQPVVAFALLKEWRASTTFTMEPWVAPEDATQSIRPVLQMEVNRVGGSNYLDVSTDENLIGVYTVRQLEDFRDIIAEEVAEHYETLRQAKTRRAARCEAPAGS